MTTWTHRTIIVPDAVVAHARAACESLAGPGGSGMYSVPLSPTGELPATHWASSGPIDEEFAHALADPDILAALAIAAGMEPSPLIALVAAASIADLALESFDETLARLGLQRCHAPAEPSL